MNEETREDEALRRIREQLAEASAASKCHPCGCLQDTVAGLERSPIAADLAADLGAARATFRPRKYDCLGCEVCFPAIAANAFSEAYPNAEGLAACPTETPVERSEWPPLPGDYRVVDQKSPVAVCVLNTESLVDDLALPPPAGLSIVGTLRTENLGIERVVQNVVANPNLRVLLLCGEDALQAIGHLPGQSLQSLFTNGIDSQGRIQGARGKRPVLKNVTSELVQRFREQVRLVEIVGEIDRTVIANKVSEMASSAPGPLATIAESMPTPIQAAEPRVLVSDPAGYVVLFPERREGRIRLEHYGNSGVLNAVLSGRTATSLYATAIERGLISRLDHAAYLGRELARAERCLETGEPYTQDRAPGEHPNQPASCCGPTQTGTCEP